MLYLQILYTLQMVPVLCDVLQMDAMQIAWQMVKTCKQMNLAGTCWECDGCYAIWCQYVEPIWVDWYKPAPYLPVCS